jgi:hypothetical protein
MPVRAVAANGRRGACQTPGVFGRCGLGDVAQLPARDHVHVDMANPSGHVDAMLGDRAAAVTGTSLGALLPDPWRPGGRGDGPDIS